MNKPNLKNYRWIVVNSSGGKDSQTALRVIVQECDRLGISRDVIVVSHQCLGRVEWQGTLDLVKAQADHYGLRLEVSKYRNKAGQELTLLDAVRNRGMWPSSQQRYCTSDFKRDPGARVIRKLFRESPGDVLNVMGFRSEESPARAKRAVFARNERLCTRDRIVHEFLPIHEWNEASVWASIKASGVPYHQAYDLGMPRLSCAFCIFAPRPALLIAGQHNPELLNEYVAIEREIGHDFQHGKPIADIQAAIAAGEQPTSIHGKWNM
jgi:3'-phosphoadenosine 5'-phosphosulfate sulfotransferase (PAPS reductase)/FAD synthetase